MDICGGAYDSFWHTDALITRIRDGYKKFEEKVFDIVGGREMFINEFANTKVVPMLLMFYCTVTGISYAPGIRGPMIIKQLIGTPAMEVDPEAFELIDLFNDYLHDRVE